MENVHDDLTSEHLYTREVGNTTVSGGKSCKGSKEAKPRQAKIQADQSPEQDCSCEPPSWSPDRWFTLFDTSRLCSGWTIWDIQHQQWCSDLCFQADTDRQTK